MPDATAMETFLASVQAELDKAKGAKDTAELTNALIAIRNLIRPWIKAFRPQELD